MGLKAVTHQPITSGGATTAGDVAVWSNTSGTLLSDSDISSSNLGLLNANQTWTGVNQFTENVSVDSLSFPDYGSLFSVYGGGAYSLNLHGGTDVNLSIQDGATVYGGLGSGVALSSVNDAGTANEPMQFCSGGGLQLSDWASGALSITGYTNLSLDTTGNIVLGQSFGGGGSSITFQDGNGDPSSSIGVDGSSNLYIYTPQVLTINSNYFGLDGSGNLSVTGGMTALGQVVVGTNTPMTSAILEVQGTVPSGADGESAFFVSNNNGSSIYNVMAVWPEAANNPYGGAGQKIVFGVGGSASSVMDFNNYVSFGRNTSNQLTFNVWNGTGFTVDTNTNTYFGSTSDDGTGAQLQVSGSVSFAGGNFQVDSSGDATIGGDLTMSGGYIVAEGSWPYQLAFTSGVGPVYFGAFGQPTTGSMVGFSIPGNVVMGVSGQFPRIGFGGGTYFAFSNPDATVEIVYSEPGINMLELNSTGGAGGDLMSVDSSGNLSVAGSVGVAGGTYIDQYHVYAYDVEAGVVNVTGNITAAGSGTFNSLTLGGSSSSFVKGNGSLDSNTYLPYKSTGTAVLVSGTKAVTISGVTTSNHAIVTVGVAGGTLGAAYKAVCTTNTLTITAISTSGSTVTTDTSTLNYIVY